MTSEDSGGVPGISIRKRRKGQDRHVPDALWHDLVDEHGRYVSVHDMKLHVIDLGSGPAALLIHGFADSSYCWHANARALLDMGLRLIIVDQPGFGRSGKPRKTTKFTIENQGQRILDAAAKVTDEPLLVVGHSMGGAIALWLARRYADRVKSIVAVAPLCRKPWRRALALPGLHVVANQLSRRFLIKKALRRLYHDRKRLRPSTVFEYTHAADRPDFFRNMASLARHFFSAEFHDLFIHVEDIQCPILLVWGDRDPWVPVKWGRALTERLPNSQWAEFPKTGHMAHQEEAEAFNAVCRSFKTRLPRARFM